LSNELSEHHPNLKRAQRARDSDYKFPAVIEVRLEPLSRLKRCASITVLEGKFCVF